MNPSDTTPLRPHKARLPSCVRCSDRKIKCDRQKPCGACVKHKHECIVQSIQPRKRTKHVKNDTPSARLARLEAALRNQGIDQPNALLAILDTEPDQHGRISADHSLTPASTTSEQQRSLTKTQMVHGAGRSRFVDNSLWSRVAEEMRDSEEALEEDSTSDASEVSEEEYGFVFGISPASKTASLHPSSDRILLLWQIFLDNVNPLTKLIHTPTMHAAIMEAVNDIESVPRSFQAFMCAIYGAAVMSLPEDECRHRLREHRTVLLSRYTSATKAALSRARLMGTSNLTVLQALVLHLFTIRELQEPRAVWTLTGVAMRIAEGMGLHRDGSYLGLPPFETEIRRRIWWQLKMHDFRTAELGGVAKFSGFGGETNTPEPPANVNDDQLYPGMLCSPIEGKEPTEMIFCVLKAQSASLATRTAHRIFQHERNSSQWHDLTSDGDTEKKDAFIDELKDFLETKYLRNCDPSKPLQLMAMLFARSICHVGHFIAHHPRRWLSIEQTPESEQQYIWTLSIKLLEQYDMMQSNSHLKRFWWHAGYYTQWHALIHILDTLRARPLMKDAEQAWQLVEATYKNNLDMLLNTKRPVYVAVGNLCLKAYSAREASAVNGNIDSEPDYIIRLRQQRKAAGARRQMRGARNGKEMRIASKKETRTTMKPDIDLPPTRRTPHTQEPHPPQGDISSQPTTSEDIIGPGENAGSNTFWFANGFGDDGISGPDDMNMNIDLMLDQDQSSENVASDGISWSQWDAWLSNSADCIPEFQETYQSA